MLVFGETTQSKSGCVSAQKPACAQVVPQFIGAISQIESLFLASKPAGLFRSQAHPARSEILSNRAPAFGKSFQTIGGPATGAVKACGDVAHSSRTEGPFTPKASTG